MASSNKPLSRSLAFCLLALALLAAQLAVSRELLGETIFDFGRSFDAPAPGFARFLAYFFVLGGLAAAALAAGLLPIARRHGRWLTERWRAGSDRRWIVYGCVFAFLVPAVLRQLLLRGMPLTDDESAYRLMAEMLARGRVWVESQPLPLFFDNRFLVNDGKVYAHYFLGWPALRVLGIWSGIGGLTNAVLSAATVPPLFLVLRRLAGSPWARAGVVLYLVSPLLMLLAATELAHTSCIAALAWFTWLALRADADGAPAWTHAGAALAFSVAFFIRPTSALGVGLPFLLYWLWRLWGRLRAGKRHEAMAALAAFALPAALLAGLFLATNAAQTGSPFTVAYERAFEYAKSNGFRFSPWAGEDDAFTEMQWLGAGHSLAVAGSAVLRLNVTLFGWPCSLLFVLAAGRGTWRSLLRAAVLCYFLLHALTHNVGIDTFAPMHYVELAWPLLLLSVAGLERATTTAVRLAPALRPLPASIAAALVAVALVAYVPVRFGAVTRIVDDVEKPFRALDEAEIENAVIFASEPFVPFCSHPPTRGWVFARPNNDPWLENDVLWVNHLSLEKDNLLMRRRFPDRRGYVMGWTRECRVIYAPLDQLPPGSVPDARVEGIEQVGTGEEGRDG